MLQAICKSYPNHVFLDVPPAFKEHLDLLVGGLLGDVELHQALDEEGQEVRWEDEALLTVGDDGVAAGLGSV